MANIVGAGFGVSKKPHKPKVVVPPPKKSHYQPIKKPVVQHTAKDLEKEKLYIKNSQKPTVTMPTSSSSTSGGGGGYSGGGGGGGNYQVVQSPQPQIDTDLINSRNKLNDLWAQANGYKTQLDDIMKKGFSYNPEGDALYKSLQEIAKKNAKTASGQALETMNDRGILNSTVTSDRLGQIEQTAQDAVTAQIPDLEASAYNKHMQQVNQLYQMWNTVYGQAKDERAFQEDSRRWQLGYEADIQQMNNQNSQFYANLDFQKGQAAIENFMQQQGLDLEREKMWLGSLADSQDGSKTSEAATQSALSELLMANSPEAAYAYLRNQAATYASQGANLSKVLDGLNKRWPGFKDGATSILGNLQ